jgi:hypothetical protein
VFALYQVVKLNETLAKLHDCCSCDADFAQYAVTSEQGLTVTEKKGAIIVEVGDSSYYLNYRTLTNSSFVKAKTKKYCENNAVLGLLSHRFYVHPGQPVGPINSRNGSGFRLVAIRVTIGASIKQTQDPPLMFRISASKDTRGLALVKDSSYTIAAVYEGTFENLGINGVAVSAGTLPQPNPNSPPRHVKAQALIRAPVAPSNFVVPAAVAAPIFSLNPSGQSIAAARAWVASHGFGAHVLQTFEAYTEGDLCALTKSDAKELLVNTLACKHTDNIYTHTHTHTAHM